MKLPDEAISAPSMSATVRTFGDTSRIPLSSTIPLMLNLRPCANGEWKLSEGIGGTATLETSATAGKIMAQVDCQHHLFRSPRLYGVEKHR